MFEKKFVYPFLSRAPQMGEFSVIRVLVVVETWFLHQMMHNALVYIQLVKLLQYTSKSFVFLKNDEKLFF